ncbi:TetR/AcrR family transcriptional regulator [Myxococcus landrumensis]|uniref:Helix-turn-helix transcriptional regulator n=1 Tax=Myxococcus landrumensis TaxID=2813577 RepID=A0ABX7NGI4_9BACT|nr:helix-turn-helix domain-containing protein [Myxococcus landrumus]QSQ17748.1 helix-turn-helix transcriptional regulator [Myxococcus landrumus]
MLGLPWFNLIVAPPRARIEEGMRERLLRVADVLMREQGRESLTWEALARRARVGRGTPRYHFGSKQKLWDALAGYASRPVVQGRR